jgi:hypothetical protein
VFHWDTLVTYQDFIRLAGRRSDALFASLTESSWIRGDVEWAYLGSVVGGRISTSFCPRGPAKAVLGEIGVLEIWADLHGAPGSEENGLDNK